jgi:hypothetical protein
LSFENFWSQLFDPFRQRYSSILLILIKPSDQSFHLNRVLVRSHLASSLTNMFLKLVDSPFDISFGNESSIKPVDLLEDLSGCHSSSSCQLESYRYFLADSLNLDFHINASLKHFFEYFFSFVAQIKSLLSVFKLISLPHINRKQSV